MAISVAFLFSLRLYFDTLNTKYNTRLTFCIIHRDIIMRITSLDVLRGFAILGILLLNITFHSNIYLGYVPFDPALRNDQIMSALSSIFADGRFRTLFCLLFGAGLAIQYESFKRRNLNAMIYLKSRLNWLVLFGFLHAVFIFGGDILMFYGLTGFLLIKGLMLPNEQIMKRVKFHIILGSIVILAFTSVFYAFYDPSTEVTKGSEAYSEAYRSWYGNYLYQVLIQGGFAIALIIVSPISILWQTLGLMYLGVYLYRSNFFNTGFTPSTLKKIMLAAVVTTALCVTPQLFLQNFPLDAIPLLSSISAIFVALLYAHIIVKLCREPNMFMRLFVAPGKMAFTLYIAQSIVMAILLRWIMPEFNKTASLFDYFLIVVIYTPIQVIVANMYMRKFKQGPLEAFWRKRFLKSAQKKQAQTEPVVE